MVISIACWCRCPRQSSIGGNLLFYIKILKRSKVFALERFQEQTILKKMFSRKNILKKNSRIWNLEEKTPWRKILKEKYLEVFHKMGAPQGPYALKCHARLRHMSLSYRFSVSDFVFSYFCVYLCVFVCLNLFVCVCFSPSHRACACDCVFACLCDYLCLFVCLTLCVCASFSLSSCLFLWLCVCLALWRYLWGVPIKSSQRCLLMWLKFISNEIVQNTKQNIIQICACQSRRHSLGCKKIHIFFKTSHKHILIWLKLTSNKNIPSPSEIGG